MVQLSCVSFANGLPFKFLLIYLVISPFFCAAAAGENFYEDKKSDQNRPFYMGSRYGRSGQPTKVQVTPRTDRFFMGSRYGKRATGVDIGEIFSPYVGSNNDYQEDVQKTLDMGKMDYSDHRMLKCTYLGIGNLYRCYSRDIEQMI